MEVIQINTRCFTSEYRKCLNSDDCNLNGISLRKYLWNPEIPCADKNTFYDTPCAGNGSENMFKYYQPSHSGNSIRILAWLILNMSLCMFVEKCIVFLITQSYKRECRYKENNAGYYLLGNTPLHRPEARLGAV